MLRSFVAAVVFSMLASPFSNMRTVARVNDVEIADSIAKKLAFEGSNGDRTVQVRVNGGVVVLNGRVDSLRSKDRFTRIAESVRGVRSVVDRMTLQVASRPDAEIHADVLRALELAAAVRDPAKVIVDVSGGWVRFAGVVGSLQEKESIARLPLGVSGVRGVKVLLVVKPAVQRPDEEIKSAIVKRLSGDPWIKGEGVRVQVISGRVVLFGSVKSQVQKHRALWLAAIQGVTAVNVQNLEVWPETVIQRAAQAQPTPRISDPELSQAVRQAILSDPATDVALLKVRALRGVVELDGKVSTLREKETVEALARSVSGLKRLRSRLEVRPVKGRSDSATEEDIRSAFALDSRLRLRPIAVKVRQGRVSLKGEVGSLYDKWLAREIAEGVKGVQVVNESLDIPLGVTELRLRNDNTTRRSIESMLRTNPLLDFDDEVKVSVVNGIATLTGIVNSSAEKTTAARDALEGGAQVVQDRLRVRLSPADKREILYTTIFPTDTYSAIGWIPGDPTFAPPPYG